MTRAHRFRSLAAATAAVVFVIVALSGGQAPKDAEQAPQRPAKKKRVAVKPLPMPTHAVSLEMRPGLKDSKRTIWDGSVEVSEGRVVEIESRFKGKSIRSEDGRFQARSVMAKQNMRDVVNRARVEIHLDAPESATVTVDTKQGKFNVKLADLAVGASKRFLDSQVDVEREQGALRLTGADTEDDYPATARAKDGTTWLAYVEYQPGRQILMERVKAGSFEELEPKDNGDQIVLRRFDGKVWHPPLDVTSEGLRVWRPAIAVDGKGDVWVAWSQQIDGNWDIFYRRYTPPAKDGDAGAWSDIVRVTNAPGTDFHVVAATDASGTV
jgi:hypothetical protein